MLKQWKGMTMINITSLDETYADGILELIVSTNDKSYHKFLMEQCRVPWAYERKRMEEIVNHTYGHVYVCHPAAQDAMHIIYEDARLVKITRCPYEYVPTENKSA